MLEPDSLYMESPGTANMLHGAAKLFRHRNTGGGAILAREQKLPMQVVLDQSVNDAQTERLALGRIEAGR
jgi:hypothetical protein